MRKIVLVMLTLSLAGCSHPGDHYAHLQENGVRSASEARQITLSVDVDTASYSNVRRYLNDGRLPPADAVRVEELVNYFSYEYPRPRGEQPFSVTTELAPCPWNPEHDLLHLGIQGRLLDEREVPLRNLVFLVDVSGSMASEDKLPLLKSALQMLVQDLRQKDLVSLVVYAGRSEVVLEPTVGSEKERISQALDRLKAGGSTNGGEGIQLAYRLAESRFVPGGINRVVLATDGDFNLGLTGEALVELIEEKRKSGVFLSVLGLGRGNLKDARMERLAQQGNGNYAYLDSLREAHKALVAEAGSTLISLAKDVKVQVAFNPQSVAEYRLIGYENRVMVDRDFEDDSKDAGEVGAGHNVTVLFEIAPADRKDRGEMATVKLRYKELDAEDSRFLARSVLGSDRSATPSRDFQFAAAVAAFGLLLRDSPHRGQATYRQVYDWASASRGQDVEGYRSEFLKLVRSAAELAG